MIEIDDKIISHDVITAHFCCDIAACKGQCCVDGNAGAPLELTEMEEYEEYFNAYKEYLTPEGITSLEEQGFGIMDFEGDLTTPLIADAECAYVTRDGNSVWCAIERAYREGKCPVNKPISCHLYPIRLTEFRNGTVGLQYHRWNICRAAEMLGASKKVRVFEAVKDAIIRRFGEDFYDQLTEVAQYIEKENELHSLSNR